MNFKKCFKCKENKVISAFYQHEAMADGHFGKCKNCTKKDASEYRWTNLEKVRAYDRARAGTPHRKKKCIVYREEYIAKFPLRYKAREVVNNAMRSGRLIAPPFCEICKSRKKLEAHHNDYNIPLNVRWLCLSCHRCLHRDLNNQTRNGKPPFWEGDK